MEKLSRTTSVFFFRFYILCENFSKIGSIIKKIPKFSDDPLKHYSNYLITKRNKHTIRKNYVIETKKLSVTDNIYK